jgi:hypothetical protein
MLTRVAFVALCVSVVFAAPVFRPAAEFNGTSAHGFDTLGFVANSTNCTTNYFGTSCDVYCLASDTCSNNGTCVEATGLCNCANSVWGANCNKTLPTVVSSVSRSVGAAGDTFTLGTSKFKIVFPAGALGSNANLEAFVFDRNSADAPQVLASQSEITVAGNFLRLLPRGQTFLVPITVTFEVDTSIVVPSGYTIKVYKLDETTGVWSPVGGTYNPSTGTVDVSLSSFSIYGTFLVIDPNSGEVSGDGNSSHVLVVAIVVSIVGAVGLVIFGMCGVSYFRNKDAREQAVPSQPVAFYPQQAAQYTAAA